VTGNTKKPFFPDSDASFLLSDLKFCIFGRAGQLARQAALRVCSEPAERNMFRIGFELGLFPGPMKYEIRHISLWAKPLHSFCGHYIGFVSDYSIAEEIAENAEK